MTSISITVDTEKKRLKFNGDKIALGEKVHVDILGVEASPTLRLRVLAGQKTIAMFPLEETDSWDGNTCVLNLNTVQAEMIKGGYGLFVIEDMDIPQLYGCGERELLPWPKERGEDVPYDLGNYPDVIEEFRKEMNDSFDGQDEAIRSKFEEFDKALDSFMTALTERQSIFEKNVNTAVEDKATNQQLTDEATARSNADDKLSKRISDNSSKIETLKTDVSNNDNAIKGEVEARKSAVETEKQRALRAESLNSEKISQEVTRAEDAEKQLRTNINVEIQNREKLQGVVNKLVGSDANKSARTIAAEEVAKVVANAPQDLDTLKEIAEYIESDKTGAAQMLNRIAENTKAITKKVDAEEGKGLSSNDFTDEDKAKLDSLSTNNTVGGYKTVEVGEDCLLLDHASNHATEARNTRDVWKTVEGVVVPSDKFTFDDSSGYVRYEEYGTELAASIPQFDFENPSIPDGEYAFYGGRYLAQGEVIFTPTQVSPLDIAGSWTGDATWTDPISGEERSTKITNGSFFSYVVGTPPATAGQPIHIVDGMVRDYAPMVGEVVDVWQAYDENGEDITSTVKVVVSSVTMTSADWRIEGVLSFPKYGLSDTISESISWSVTDKVFSVEYSHETSGNELVAYLSFPLNGALTEGEVYYNSPSEINVYCVFNKSSKVELIPPGPVPGRPRDFIVVFDAQTDGLNIEMPGIKEVDEDVLKMEAGRNAIYISEFVQGELYATRKLLEAPAS